MNGKNTVQKRYQVSLGYIIGLAYTNSNYDIIEFENVEDYGRSKVTEYTWILKTGEDMIKINTSGMRFFSNKKYGAWDDGVKILVMTIGDPTFTLTPITSPIITPDIHIIYEIYNWKQGATSTILIPLWIIASFFIDITTNNNNNNNNNNE